MLRTRVITGCILGALLLLGLFLLPPFWAVLAFAAVFTIGAWEFAGLGLLQGVFARGAYTAAILLALFGAWRWTDRPHPLLTLLIAACIWWMAALLWLSLAPARHRAWVTLACGLPVLVPSFVALARLQLSEPGSSSAHGPAAVLWLVLMVCSADIGAYSAGRAFGKHKLAPRVSPGKTWEGALGGLAAVTLVAGCGAVYFGLSPLAWV